MSKKEIEAFGKKHMACREGMEWAMSNCNSMSEVWEKSREDWLFWVATREGVISEDSKLAVIQFCLASIKDHFDDSEMFSQAAGAMLVGEKISDELFALIKAAADKDRAGKFMSRSPSGPAHLAVVSAASLDVSNCIGFCLETVFAANSPRLTYQQLMKSIAVFVRKMSPNFFMQAIDG